MRPSRSRHGNRDCLCQPRIQGDGIWQEHSIPARTPFASRRSTDNVGAIGERDGQGLVGIQTGVSAVCTQTHDFPGVGWRGLLGDGTCSPPVGGGGATWCLERHSLQKGGLCSVCGKLLKRKHLLHIRTPPTKKLQNCVKHSNRTFTYRHGESECYIAKIGCIWFWESGQNPIFPPHGPIPQGRF
ncbi:hypothetical protein NDU88_005577 [Pleurodeles waltl]|uniref:Uncharacterized protein n=1 Tax=Pleurodeles waltl TaxID=8319 RepID=A0AAV7TBS3_PLEWA|nr:hypothetical protein NDU88_005577 [Pleurodeles waltl]